MRKIKSKYEEEKKQKRNNYILGMILIIVMFGSIFGIIVSSFGKKNSNSSVEYNGVTFLNQNNLWYASVANSNFVFHNNPFEINYTDIGKIKHLDNYRNKPLYVYSEDYDSRIEIYKNMENIVERMQPSCLDKNNCDGDYPVKTCADNVIIIQISNSSNISQEENCVYIKGSENELINLTDEFLFRAIGIK